MPRINSLDYSGQWRDVFPQIVERGFTLKISIINFYCLGLILSLGNFSYALEKVDIPTALEPKILKQTDTKARELYQALSTIHPESLIEIPPSKLEVSCKVKNRANGAVICNVNANLGGDFFGLIVQYDVESQASDPMGIRTIDLVEVRVDSV